MTELTSSEGKINQYSSGATETPDSNEKLIDKPFKIGGKTETDNPIGGEIILARLKDIIYSLYKENKNGGPAFRTFLLVIFQYSIILFCIWLGDHTSFNEDIGDLPGLISIPIIMIIISFIILLTSKNNLGANYAFFAYLICCAYICMQLTNYIDTKYIMVIIGLIMSNSLGVVIYVFIFPEFRYLGFLISIFIASLIAMLIFGFTVLKDSTKWILITIGIDIFEVIFTSLCTLMLNEDSEKEEENAGIVGSSIFNYGRIVVLLILGFICMILYSIFTGKIFENAGSSY